ncbi:MAG: PAS domain S-box protein [Pirellulales bacterium]
MLASRGSVPPKAERFASGSADFLQEVIDAIAANIHILDADGRVVHTNAQWNTGVECKSIFPVSLGVGENYLSALRTTFGRHGADALRAAEGIEQVIAGNICRHSQLYACHTSAKPTWFRLEVRPLAHQLHRRVVVAHFNVTNEELAQQELQQHRQQTDLLAMVAKFTDNAVVITDADARIEWVNDGFVRLTGYTLDEVRGRVPGEFLQGAETDPHTVEVMRQARRSKQGFNVEILNYSKDGRKYWSNIEVRPIHDTLGEVTRFIAVEADVTQRRATEENLRHAKMLAEKLVQELQESRQTLDYALFGAEVGLWQWNIETNETIYNQRWVDLLGYPLEDFVQHIDAFNDLLHPEDAQRVWDAIEAHCSGITTSYEADYRLQVSSGEYRWFHARGRVIETTADGRPLLMAGTIADIHEKKLVEQQLESEQRLLSSIMDTLPHAIFWKNRRSVFLGCNRAFAEHAGLRSPHEIVGLSDNDLPRNAEETARIRRFDAEIMESGKSILNHEESIVEGDANKTVLTSKVALKDKNGRVTGILGIYHDITERKQLQMRLAQAQKLESIGQLAAGIAHEINTPMQFVYDNVEFLNECLSKMFEVVQAYQQNLCPQATPKSWEERHREISQATERCQFDRIQRQVPEAVNESLEGLRRVIHIVRAIKQFSHPGSAVKIPSDLNEGLRSTVTIARNQWKYVAELNLELDPELPAVECLPGEINQVFLNLIVNAADAIADHCASGAIQRGTISVRTRREGDDAVIEVEDNGNGIPEHVQQHVFVPFFTTKKIGQGSGQGLPISYDVVVNQHGGSIDFSTIPGEGTIFTVRIPLQDDHSETAESLADPALPPLSEPAECEYALA